MASNCRFVGVIAVIFKFEFLLVGTEPSNHSVTFEKPSASASFVP